MSEFDADLWWYWNEADGDMGKHAASLQPRTSGGVQDFAPSGSQLKAAGKYSDIELSLHQLDQDQIEILRLAHTPVPPSLKPQLVKLGDLAHVVMHLAPSPAWVMERVASKSSDELTGMVAKAKRIVAKAVKRFQNELDQWKRAKSVERVTKLLRAS